MTNVGLISALDVPQASSSTSQSSKENRLSNTHLIKPLLGCQQLLRGRPAKPTYLLTAFTGMLFQAACYRLIHHVGVVIDKNCSTCSVYQSKTDQGQPAALTP